MDLDRTKKIIYIIIGVAVLAAAAYLAYRSFFAPTEVGKTPGEEEITGRPTFPGGTGGLGEEIKPGEEGKPLEVTTKEGKKLTRLADFPVISPSLNRDGTKILYYKKDGGDLFADDFGGGNQEKVSNITILGIIEALWSRTGDRAAAFYLDNDTLKGFIHAGTTSITALPSNVRSFAWSPDGRSLAYLLEREGNANLVVADASGANPRTIFSTPILDAKIDWITGDRLAFTTAPSALAEGFMFLFSRSGGAFTKVLGPLLGLTSLWSADGTRTLVSATNGSTGETRLSIRDTAGERLFDISLQTLPEKCFWATVQELYCAAPREIPSGSILPDDYLRGELNTADRIVHLNLDKKETSVALDEGSFDVSNLTVSKNQEYLFFVNRIDGTLWSLKLK